MDTKVSALAVANYFIQKSKKDNIPVTHLKLQKLTYLAHGWYLAIYNTPLYDDDVVAWQYGPVLIEIYNVFKSYRKLPIHELGYSQIQGKRPQVEDESILSFLDEIWNIYKDLDAVTLVNITHAIGGPWDYVYYTLGGKDLYNPSIPNHQIKNYYKKMLETQEVYAERVM